MCGIIAVLRRRSTRSTPRRDEIESALQRALAVELQLDPDALPGGLDEAAGALEEVDRALRGAPGIELLLAEPELCDLLARELRALELRVESLENSLDSGASGTGPGGQPWRTQTLETVNAGIVRLRDATWAAGRDRLSTARAVGGLLGEAPRERHLIESYAAIHAALASIDRQEVRGRDSAGIQVLVRGVTLDAEQRAALAVRSADPLYRSEAVRILQDGTLLAFVYKRSAEIGELGDNIAAIRAAIVADRVLRAVLRQSEAAVTVLGHTRWASVGIISEPNAHPVDSLELDQSAPPPFVSAVLNGDVDNHSVLAERHHLRLSEEITTDAKVIPTLLSRRQADGLPTVEAFRRTVSEFEGSTAIASSSEADPDELLLALRGSGQALYVGVAEDCYVIASEPYGVVEECTLPAHGRRDAGQSRQPGRQPRPDRPRDP
jgi:glucosamine--fructose-6-phosphate aminotransferase (isomerizing)